MTRIIKQPDSSGDRRSPMSCRRPRIIKNGSLSGTMGPTDAPEVVAMQKDGIVEGVDIACRCGERMRLRFLFEQGAGLERNG